MRWADLDLLGHVNNVTYVDYLQEARVDLLRRHRGAGAGEHGDPAEGVLVVRHEVTYLRPLLFRFEPVLVECWVTEIRAASFTVAYEVFRESTSRPGERTVFCRATTVLAPYRFDQERPRRLTEAERAGLADLLEPGDPVRAPRLDRVERTPQGHTPVPVRFSDLDVYGHVNNVTYVEYFQEARLLYLMQRLWAGLAPADLVVAQADIDYRRPIVLREQPYDCWSQVVRVGERSTTIQSEICDGDQMLARALVTVVFVDAETGRAAPPAPAHRDPLVAALRA